MPRGEGEFVTPDTLGSSKLRVGYDILADAFGDHVYCKMRNKDEAECPLCGHWALLITINKLREIGCHYCGFHAICEVVLRSTGNWAIFFTKRIIGHAHYHGVTQLFFPRVWNNGKPWIRLTDFETKYKNYMKDKTNV